MGGLEVIIISSDEEQGTILQLLLEGTAAARVTHSFSTLPAASTDQILTRIQDLKPDVLLVDIPHVGATAALAAIELLNAHCPKAAVFALGEMEPNLIVSAMRAGAREYLQRPPTASQLLEALSRLVSAQRKHGGAARGKVYTVLNAKGGSGATTVAVNTALALHAARGNTALVDLAPLGNAAFHLNLKPAFSVADTLRNLHRLDASLLEGFMTRHQVGLHVLAGGADIHGTVPEADLARLLDLMVSHYRIVIIDLSGRLDAAARTLCDLSETVLMVSHSDVSSLWRAAQVKEFLGSGTGNGRVKLVLNRFRKVAGLSDNQIETATRTKVFWKIPNHYSAISTSIDCGVPVTQQNHSDVARCFVDLANSLIGATSPTEPRRWLFRSA